MTNKQPDPERTPPAGRQAHDSDALAHAAPAAHDRKTAPREDEEAAAADSPRRAEELDVPWAPTPRGLGPDAGGQAGDTEGLSREELSSSESVEELIEEGQAYEAEVISGIENAPEADRGEVRTRQVPEDDVPQEYLDED